MIEVADATRQNKNVCQQIRDRADCRYATLSKLVHGGEEKEPTD